MSFFNRVTGTLFNWVSPQRTLTRRDKPFKAPEQLVHTPKIARRTRRNGPSVSRGRRSRRTPSNRSAPSTTSSRESGSPAIIKEEVWSPVGSSFITTSFRQSSSVLGHWSAEETTPNKTNTDPYIEDNVYDQEVSFDANENTRVLTEDQEQATALAVAGGGFTMDRDAKIQSQQLKVDELRGEGWNDDTIDLYMLIDRRTYEPLFPANWFGDFPLFPGNIFIAEAQDALLRPLYGSHLSAIKAIQHISGLGIRVRDSCKRHTTINRRPEALIETAIKRYCRWAYKDARLARDVRKRTLLPLIAVTASHPGEKINRGEEILLSKLQKISVRYLNDLRVVPPSSDEVPDVDSRLFFRDDDAYICEPPTLYGIFCHNHGAVVIAYEPLSAHNAVRHIAFFDFSKPEHDVWNALALALVVTYSRNHMLHLKEIRPIEYDSATTEFEDIDA
jgi:hypothetical protein